jgi:internalin A
MKMPSWSPARIAIVFLTLVFLWWPGLDVSGQSQSGKSNPPSALVAALSAKQILADPTALHQRLKDRNPDYNGNAQFAQDQTLGLVGDFTGSRVSDLSPLAGIPFNAIDLRGQTISDLDPLKGMPLTLLGIEDTQVNDLTPLTGIKLQKLYLNNAPVVDLRPLAGMPLKELMLAGTKVKNLMPLKGSPLQSLWLNNTPVSDISPLAGCRLVSLTLEGTWVADLKPLSKMTTLKRLHIGRTQVTDLMPLKALKLTRLVFTPGSITKGLDVARNMKSLREVGTSLDVLMPPGEFWSRYEGTKGK